MPDHETIQLIDALIQERIAELVRLRLLDRRTDPLTSEMKYRTTAMGRLLMTGKLEYDKPPKRRALREESAR